MYVIFLSVFSLRNLIIEESDCLIFKDYNHIIYCLIGGVGLLQFKQLQTEEPEFVKV